MLTVASFVLDAIPQLEWLHPYLLTQHWKDFGELLRDPVSFGGSAGAVVAAPTQWSSSWRRGPASPAGRHQLSCSDAGGADDRIGGEPGEQAEQQPVGE